MKTKKGTEMGTVCVDCRQCDGYGYVGIRGRECDSCDGSGKTEITRAEFLERNLEKAEERRFRAYREQDEARRKALEFAARVAELV